MSETTPEQSKTTDIQKSDAKPIDKQDRHENSMLPPDMSPMQMVATMVMNGASQEELDKIMAFAKEMDAIQSEKAYAQAMTNFKALCPTIIRSGKGHTNTYAKLVDIDEQIRNALAQCQLTPSWRIIKNEKDWIEVECRVTHSMRHYESTCFGGPPDRGPARNELQARASTVSYLERYTLKALLGLVDKDMPDDDGAGGAPTSQPTAAPTSVTGSIEDKRRLANLFIKAAGLKKASKEDHQRWHDELLALVDLPTYAEYAAWFQANAGISKDGHVVRTTSGPAGENDQSPDTDVSRAEQAPLFSLSDDQSQWPLRCAKCGTSYKKTPANGLCIAKDEDGFKCGGEVGPREESDDDPDVACKCGWHGTMSACDMEADQDTGEVAYLCPSCHTVI